MKLTPSELLKLLEGKKYDLHTHTKFSDGRHSPEEMIKKAIENGLDIIGISDHGPLPFEGESWAIPFNRNEALDEYISQLSQLKTKYQDQIKVLIGLEIDYFPNQDNHYKKLKLDRFDYTIGSVHFFDLKKDDGQLFSLYDGQNDYHKMMQNYGGMKQLAANYYRLVTEAAKSKLFSFLGHYDLIKINNLNFNLFNENEAWYQEIALAHLDELANLDTVLEINTSYKRKGGSNFHPSEFLLEKITNLGIKTLINTDSHHVDHLKNNR